MRPPFNIKKCISLLFVTFLFSTVAMAQVGIGTIDPITQLDIEGAISLREGTTLILTNGSNTNISLGTTPYSVYRITGPTGDFEIGSIVPETGADGQLVTFINTTSQDMTVIHTGGGGPLRIYCPNEVDTEITGMYSSATFQYNATITKWILINPRKGSDDWTITGNTGTTTGTNFLGTTDDVDLMFKRNNLESGRISDSNTSIGLNSLTSLTSGTKNSAFGHDALVLNTTGIENTAIGNFALDNNATANNNTAVGYQALSANTNQHDNTAMGAYALKSNTTGFDNSAFGRSALQNNTSGLGNAAFGEHSLFNNLGGSSNTAVGENALEENTSGIGNVVIGEDAGTRNTTGSGNVVIGQEALFSDPLGISTGDNNVIIGRYAAQSNTSGRLNVIIGKDAMLSSTSANFNVIMGVGAGSDPDSISDAAPITTGDQNTLIGYKTQVGSSSAENATAIGFRALADCDDCLILGGVSGVNSGTSVNVGIGNNDPSYELDVTGDIRFSGSMRSGGSVIHPDYVFETYFDNDNSFKKDYKFMSLNEVDTFLKNNYHLPGVQSRDDVLENGWVLSENVRVNLEKIEELFLHTIELDKKVTHLQEDKNSLLELIEIQKEQLKKQGEMLNEILEKLQNK